MPASTLPVEAYDRGDMKKKLATGTLLTSTTRSTRPPARSSSRPVFPNDDNALFPNQFVNTKLLVEMKKDVVLVPVAAIQHGNTRHVRLHRRYAIQEHTVSMKNVTVGTIDGDQAEIQSGVARGRRRGHRRRRQAAERQQGHLIQNSGPGSNGGGASTAVPRAPRQLASGKAS